MVKQIITSHHPFLSSPVPFQPSKLTLSLSVCFLALVSSQAQAASLSQLQSQSTSQSQKTPLNAPALNLSQSLPNKASRLDATQTDRVINNTFNSDLNSDFNSDFANGPLVNNELTNKQAQTTIADTQLEEALVALKLKQAVERGLIDASVLEDYKRETLNYRGSANEATNDVSNSHNATNVATNNTQNDAVSDSDSDTILEALSYPPQKTDDVTEKNATIALRTSDDFDQQFNDAGFDKGLDVADIVNNGSDVQSPSEIEQTLAQIEADIAANIDTQFDAPVARLDAQTAPLGFDASIQDLLPVPSNQETLGINNTVSPTQVANSAANKPLNGFVQTPSNQPTNNESQILTSSDAPVNPVDEANNSDINNIAAANPVVAQGVATNQATDVTTNQATNQIVSQVNNQATSNITGEQIAQAQKEGDIATGIDPDEYLPEYQNNNMNEATADAISASDAKDDTKAGDGVGFFKGLYNRLFNGGYASLPKIKANIYVQDNTRRDAAGQSLLVKADKDTQPIDNIEAVLENIAVEAIQDFPSVLPKLREEALNAAQAVGYYDVNLQFKREDDNTVAVIITQLGEPVRVNNRLVDIRGEGEDLAEFETIVEKSPPLPGDVFNHGVYKNIKADIEKTTEQFGFFDSRWLNSSVDIILPDKTADIDLIYDTQKRYEFGEVVFFTIDPDTGQLTTDPDKLPVAPKLLHQLYDFEQGDKFYQPLVTSFTNDLSATRYFNMVNVEPIRPSTEGETESNLAFEAVANAGLDADARLDADTIDAAVNSDSSLLPDSNDDSNSDNLTASTDVDNDIKPIEFSIDQQTSERLQAITDKAERLTRLPDDRVLDEKEVEAKSFLGKLSNAVSNAFKKILPDEEKDLAVAGRFDNDLSDATLQARITPQKVAETKQIPFYVFVMADKPKDLSLGLGYGTDTGVRAVARYDNNLINRKGYQAGASIGVSKINQSLSVHGSRPWKHPLDDILLANLSLERELINQGEGTLDLTSNTIKAGIARNIHSDSGWNRSYSLRYRLDQLESGVDDISRKALPVPFNRNDAKFNQEALLLGYTLDKTVTDNLINPTKGWHQYYSIEAGADSVLTDTNMAILRAGANGVYSFGDFNKHQVIGRLEGGYIWADSFEDVPYKLRFFAGGDGSIRGYDYNSLSTLENGYLIGGQVLALGSGEYNYEFKPGFRGAVFADVGNAYDTQFDTETKLGVGLGIRWASPVGMVRLDLAAGVLEDSIPIRLHFFIGSPLQ